jgi:hypothetical protein
VLAIGSANFTTAGLGLTSQTGNAEVLLVYPPFSSNTFDLSAFFDPLGSAILLTDASKLLSVLTEEPSASTTEYEQVLESASVEENELIIRGSDLRRFTSCLLQQQGMRPMTLPEIKSGRRRCGSAVRSASGAVKAERHGCAGALLTSRTRRCGSVESRTCVEPAGLRYRT